MHLPDLSYYYYSLYIGNAHNPNKECGGSSGGEGSLIGSGGSILGLGSDVGGSLRNPAFFNGIYSLKPTHGRHLSTLGVCINSGGTGTRNTQFSQWATKF